MHDVERAITPGRYDAHALGERWNIICALFLFIYDDLHAELFLSTPLFLIEWLEDSDDQFARLVKIRRRVWILWE